MAYTPNTWASGDTITAAKLNNMEQGIASAGGVVQVGYTFEDGTITLDKTWQEINDGMAAGNIYVIVFNPEDFADWGWGYIVAIIECTTHYSNSPYGIHIGGDYTLEASTPTDYLHVYIGD